MNIFKIELGAKVTDAITGFKGIVTGRAEYITGCRQYGVAPRVGKNNEVKDALWIDEDRLLGSVKKKVTKRNIGGPRSDAPSKI